MSNREKIYLAGAGAAICLALRFCILPLLSAVFSALLPFFVALAVSAAVLPLARRISRALPLRVELVGVLLTLLALALLLAMLFFASRALVYELGELFGYLSGESSPLPRLIERLEGLIASLGLTESLPSDGSSLILSPISELLSALAARVGSYLAELPSILFFLLSSSIAAFYLVLWLPGALDAMPPSLRKPARDLGRGLVRGLAVYGRAYLILFFVTGGISLLGLALLSAPYPLLFALALALVDLLPLLGVGALLVPYAIWSFFVGRFGFGLGLVALCLVVTVTRRILEDRLIGRGFGLHPLLILLSICLGLRFFGFLGLFVGPILLSAVGLVRNKKAASNASGT